MAKGASRQMWQGTITEHRRIPGWGFDPVVSGHALDLASMEVIRRFLKDRPVRKALDLGTGSGNGLQLLLDLGAVSILTVDQDKRWQRVGDRQASLHARTASPVKFHVAKLLKTGAYDLAEPFAAPFDVALVDGPCNDPPARIATATQVQARCYIFHDWNRDKALIEGFIAGRSGYRWHASSGGRGVCFVWKAS